MRPVVGGAERAEWDRWVDAHHYLGFRCLFGGGVRHVAVAADGRWLAVLEWQHQPEAHRHYAVQQADALRDDLAPAF